MFFFLHVNRKWCNTVFVRKALCTPDIELLSVSLRSFYLPREFPQLLFTLVYIHPRANASRAIEHITDNIHKLDSIFPDASKFILFNKTIDLCFGTVPGAYTSLALPPLGSADHSSVLLAPVYKPVIRKP